MMYGKAVWKPGIGEIAKASSGIAPEPHKGGLKHPIQTSSCNGHKTQFFMKNRGQQKCLDKALLCWEASKISMEASNFLCRTSWSTWSYGILDFSLHCAYYWYQMCLSLLQGIQEAFKLYSHTFSFHISSLSNNTSSSLTNWTPGSPCLTIFLTMEWQKAELYGRSGRLNWKIVTE